MNFSAAFGLHCAFEPRYGDKSYRQESRDVLRAAIRGTTGDDTLDGTEDADTIEGLEGNDTVNGGDGDDIIYNGNGNDVLRGGLGNDTFYNSANGPSSDQAFGGAGYDRFRLSAVRGDLLVDGGERNDLMILGIGIFGFAEGTLNTYVINAGTGSDSLLLGSGGNTFTSINGEVDLSQSDLNIVDMGIGDDNRGVQ